MQVCDISLTGVDSTLYSPEALSMQDGKDLLLPGKQLEILSGGATASACSGQSMFSVQPPHLGLEVVPPLFDVVLCAGDSPNSLDPVHDPGP